MLDDDDDFFCFCLLSNLSNNSGLLAGKGCSRFGISLVSSVCLILAYFSAKIASGGNLHGFARCPFTPSG